MSDHIKSIVVEGRSQMQKLIAEALKRKLTRKLHHASSLESDDDQLKEDAEVDHDLGELYDELQDPNERSQEQQNNTDQLRSQKSVINNMNYE